MGPPTISADQPGGPGGPMSRRAAFNGAADDLGGSTHPIINLTDMPLPPSMGPPTISADQLRNKAANRNQTNPFNGAADDLGGSTPIQHLNTSAHIHPFNGAADDLGGSTHQEADERQQHNVPSMGPPTISADQPPCASWPHTPDVLQWGRRRSRRINGDLNRNKTGTEPPSMGPPTISADQHVMQD